jgi:tRNA modification GTPase
LGIERTRVAIQEAGLALLVVDATRGVAKSDGKILAELPEGLPVITVLNKVDLLTNAHGEADKLLVSAKTGQGMTELRQKLLEAAGWHAHGEGVFMARERHLRALEAGKNHLAIAQIREDALDLFAEELRLAQTALSTITGEFTADDLLGEIFSRFCIGK